MKAVCLELRRIVSLKMYELLHIHAANFCLPVIPELLQHPKLDPNLTDGAGRTALHFLCNNYTPFPFLNDCIQQMANHPAIKINARDEKMYTPLMYAAANGNMQACLALLGVGANKTLLNAYDCTAERLAELNGHNGLAKMIHEYDDQPAVQENKTVAEERFDYVGYRP